MTWGENKKEHVMHKFDVAWQRIAAVMTCFKIKIMCENRFKIVNLGVFVQGG